MQGKSFDNNTKAFIVLVRAGLWEKEARLSQYGEVDFSEIYHLAEEQSVIGLVSAGLEHVTDYNTPKEIILQFVGSTLQLEQRNQHMNVFLKWLVEKLKAEGVSALLVKGQGIAHCYERPLWRASGDVDLLLDSENYEKAKKVLKPLSDAVAEEETLTKHQALTIRGFEVELHGRMPFLLSRCVDTVIDVAIKESTSEGKVRVWNYDGTEIYLPAVDNDVMLVFTHFLHHFFIEGVGLRQICDWCRLLWTYRSELNVVLLEQRLQKMGLMTEWKVFASLAVEILGMPEDAMPFYDSRFKVKVERVLRRILECGNFGHNNDLSYRIRYKGISYKIVATWRRFFDFASLAHVFPIDAPKFFLTYLFSKAK